MMGKTSRRSRAHADPGPDPPASIPTDYPPNNVEARAPPIPTANNHTTHAHTSEEESTPPTPESRKQKRQRKKSPGASSLPTPPSSTSPTPPPTPPTMRPTPALSTASKSYPLLVASIGNPGATYAHTLHSAGHTITTHIASVKRSHPFTKGLSGLVARPDHTTYAFNPLSGFRKTDGGLEPGGDDWTFWQSTALMNVSGKSLARAWREFAAEKGSEARLVVVHDELEQALGKVSVREGKASAKGHNGIKSVQGSLGGARWWRVGVGIGRPESREPDVVARYVLRKMRGEEMRAMERACGGVVDALREIAEGRR